MLKLLGVLEKEKLISYLEKLSSSTQSMIGITIHLPERKNTTILINSTFEVELSAVEFRVWNIDMDKRGPLVSTSMVWNNEVEKVENLVALIFSNNTPPSYDCRI